MSQGFRRELVDRCEAVLDVSRSPHHRRDPSDYIIDLYRASVRRLAFAAVALFRPVQVSWHQSGCQLRVLNISLSWLVFGSPSS